MEAINIVFIENPEERELFAWEVLSDLPEWFGLPEQTEAYIKAAKMFPFWIAKSGDDCLGFIDLRPTSKQTAEIHCMGVKKKWHHQGIGRLLFDRLLSYAKESYMYLQVKTVAEGHYPEYDQTIAFYEACGFSRLEVFPTLWDEWNPCLILVRSI